MNMVLIMQCILNFTNFQLKTFLPPSTILRLVELMSHANLKRNEQTYHNHELGTLEWWISGLMLDPLFFLISRLNIACSPLVINLHIN